MQNESRICPVLQGGFLLLKISLSLNVDIEDVKYIVSNSHIGKTAKLQKRKNSGAIVTSQLPQVAYLVILKFFIF